jgi:dTDP-L-rhamnose 4-epimerase
MILVTGGLGFIGSHTADALLQRGEKVRILDNLSEPVHRKQKPDYIPNGAELMIGDVRKKDDWRKALDGVNSVFHFAAYQDYLNDFSTFFHTNTVGTALLYEVAVEERIALKKIVVASSQAVYGEGAYTNPDSSLYFPDLRPREQLEQGRWDIEIDRVIKDPVWTSEERVNPQNQYALSKYAQETASLHLGKRFDLPTVCLRYSIVQGPRQSLYNAYSGACRIFSLCHHLEQHPVIFEDGMQWRDFVNIKDVVNANLLVWESEAANFESFNVGGGRRYSVLEFAKIVAQVFGSSFEYIMDGSYRYGDTRHIFSNIDKLKSLGWQPEHDPIKSVEDYREWLSGQEMESDIVEKAFHKMRDQSVVRKLQTSQN